MSRIKALLESLSERDARVQKCLSTFQENQEKEICETGTLDIDHVLGIYRRRAEWNEKQGVGIKGFDELLRNLESTGLPVVRIHSFLTAEGRFIIFTDDAESKLLGVLTKVSPDDEDWKSISGERPSNAEEDGE